MVRVAVQHGYSGGLALRLEPPPGAAELDDRRLGLGSRDTGELERREGCSRVASVVLSGHTKLELHGLELLRAHDLRHLAQPVLEERLHLGAGAKRRVVVEVDVEQDGDLRSQRADGSIRLVPFDHQPTGPRSGVAAELWHVAAD